MIDVENKVQRYEKYKESGVEWLGDIPEHWETRKIKFFYKNKDSIFIDGDWIESKDIGSNEVYYFTTGNIRELKFYDKERTFISNKTFAKLNCTEIYENDILISRLNLPIGRCCLAPKFDKKTIVSVDVCVLRADQEFNRSFLVYVMNSPQYFSHTENEARGAIMKRISRTILGNISLPIPPLLEQTKIAQFLDDKTTKIDDAIAIKQHQINLLKERKQILIHKAVTRGLDDNVTLKDSGVEWIGEIPEHWEVKKIKHVTSKIGSGVTPSGGGTTYLDKGIPLLRSQNIFFDKIELDGVAFISDKVHQSMSNSQVFKGDVLLNITGGSIGRCYFVNIDIPLNVNQHVCILRPNKKITTLYLNRLIASEVGQNQIWFHQQGGGREGLNFQALKNFSIPFPPLSEQKEISEYIETASQKIETSIGLKQQEIDTLKEYKRSLINGVVTGKVKIF